jgi:hypothetical protein
MLGVRCSTGRAHQHDSNFAVLVIPTDVLAVLRQLRARPLRAQLDDLIEEGHKMSRLIATTIALPSSTAVRVSVCTTRSSATSSAVHPTPRQKVSTC